MKDDITARGPDPFETQRLGRAAITAMAYPGRIITCDARLAALLQTFVPTGTRLFLDRDLQGAGAAVPGARLVDADRATVAAAQAVAAPALLPLLPRGAALHPEEGTLLILAVAALSEAAEGPRYRVTRGAAGGQMRDLGVTGLPETFAASRAAANAAYPLGIDILLVDEVAGRLAGLPRHVRFDMGEI